MHSCPCYRFSNIHSLTFHSEFYCQTLTFLASVYTLYLFYQVILLLSFIWKQFSLRTRPHTPTHAHTRPHTPTHAHIIYGLLKCIFFHFIIQISMNVRVIRVKWDVQTYLAHIRANAEMDSFLIRNSRSVSVSLGIWYQ